MKQFNTLVFLSAFAALTSASPLWADEYDDAGYSEDTPSADMVSDPIAAGRVHVLDNSAYGTELWLENPQGDYSLLRDIVPGPDGSNPDIIAQVNGVVFSTAYTPFYGRELWVTDGTPQGTQQLQDIYPGQGDSNPNHFLKLDGGVYFIAD